MPSLRKRVTSYIRQLSFHNEPREKRQNINENSFITKYLQGQIKLKDGPPVISGKIPTDLPNYDLATYTMGPDTIIGCYTGPNGGLTTVKRTEKHLSVTDPDIDFIDTQEESASNDVKIKLESKKVRLPIDNTTMVIKVAGQEYFVTNRKKQIKSQSLGSLSDLTSESKELNESQYTSLCNDNSIEFSCEAQICNGTDEERSSEENLFQNDSILKTRKMRTDQIKHESIGCDNKEVGTGKGISKDNVMQKHSDLKTHRSGSKKYDAGCSELKHINGSMKSIADCARRRSNSNKSNSSVKTFNQNLARNTQQNTSDQNRDSNKISNQNRKQEKKTPSKVTERKDSERNMNDNQNYMLSKSKSEGNPFQHRKKGKIIKLSQRPISTVSAISTTSETGMSQINDLLLPEEWQKYSDQIYGLSDSLYDRNQVTKTKNGDPIADCFGIITRKDSAILAVADGVNWGEKACIAAKSAIHGCLHYLNKTVFNDVKPFENLVKMDSKDVKCETPLHEAHVTNTQEVFVCLLRAFNCAHNLILENNGMLTTLTVAIVLPLKQSSVSRTNGEYSKKQESGNYVCCVCNVGDTLAYIYSHKYGVRELTKGSHDIQSNRDMRDALGALGPVDGTNPELSNLTLSITKIEKGDIIFLASDGLTDNFDPNVCKFTVNSNIGDALKSKKESTVKLKESPRLPRVEATKPKTEEVRKPPAKPPRRSYAKPRDNINKPAEKTTPSSSEESKSAESENLKISTADVVDNAIALPNKSNATISEVKPKFVSLNSNSSTETKNTTNKTVEIANNYDFPSNHPSHTNNNVNIKNSNSTTEKSSNINDINSNNQQGTSHTLENRSNNSSANLNTRAVKSTQENDVALKNPLVAQFLRENSLDENTSLDKCRRSLNESKPIRNFSSQLSMPSSHTMQHQQLLNKTLDKGREITKITEGKQDTQRYNFLRSKTSLDLRTKPIQRNEDGIPYVTPIQRYELTLLFMEDILKHGISGREPQCVTAKKLCENLMRFTFSITAAKRRTLEDNDLYYDNHNGLLVEVSTQERKIRRKKGLEKVQNLPGKLDHVTVVAFNVGNYAFIP